jgi:hypothetical protein
MSATNFNEPPCAEPHAGGCGGWELVTPGYPIRGEVIIVKFFLVAKRI